MTLTYIGKNYIWTCNKYFMDVTTWANGMTAIPPKLNIFARSYEFTNINDLLCSWRGISKINKLWFSKSVSKKLKAKIFTYIPF